ncbi:MAG: LamG domain-containing protein [Bacteroidota bacterium]
MKTTLFFISLLLTLPVVGQETLQHGLSYYWTFDSSESTDAIFPEFGDVNSSGKLSKDLDLLRTGKRKNALALGKTESAVFEISEGADLYNFFSIGFWFLTTTLQKEQTLFHQFDGEGRYMKFMVSNNHFVFKYKDGRGNEGKQVYKVENFQSDEWNYVMLTLEGADLTVYFNCFQLPSNRPKKVIMNLRESQKGDMQYWGNNQELNSPFIGKLDEITIYERVLSDIEIDQLCSGSYPIEYDEPKEVEEDFFDGKKIHFKDQLKVLTATNIAHFKIWDSQKIDGDSVALFINGELIGNFQLRSEKEANIGSFSVQSDTTNVLLLYALNTGELGANTAKIEITLGRKKFKIELSSDKDRCEAIPIKVTPRTKRGKISSRNKD